MSTSRRSGFPGISKKISSWVRPGVCEVRARLLRPVSALIRLDLPTLERPAKAISSPAIGGNCSIAGAAQTNCQSPANSFRPASISLASVSLFMRGLSGYLRHCERSEAIQTWLRGDSLDCFVASLLAMTLRRLFRRERRLEIVEQFHLHPVPVHDVALLRHRKQVVPGPVDHEPGREARQHEGENQRHPVEDHLLRRIGL